MSQPDWKTITGETVQNLSRLIQADTTNPPGNELPAVLLVKDILEREGFSQEDFTIVESAPNRVNLIARLSELLRKMTSLVEELSLTDVTTRLAHRIVSMVGDNETRSRPVVSLAEKKTVLASQLGTIPETLSRSFARLSKEKVIAIDGARIEILDLKKLRELAGD